MSTPTIDLRDPEALVVKALAAACRDWGLFQVTGHGLPPERLAAVQSQQRVFFELPTAQKRNLTRTVDNPWGFYDRELTKNLRDKKEVFDVGPEQGAWATGRAPSAEATPWPTHDPQFRSVISGFAAACEALAARLLRQVMQGLGAPEAALRDAFAPASTSFLRLNYYPTLDPLADEADPVAPGADLGIHHHTDAGALTVLLQDQVSGLQVRRNDRWVDVAPTPGALVINIGDMMQVWSNDRYRAPVHRVLAMDRQARFSLAYFYNPAYAAVVAPLSVLGSDPPRYHGIRWGEFRRRRADGDFADYGAEVQISDYRR